MKFISNIATMLIVFISAFYVYAKEPPEETPQEVDPPTQVVEVVKKPSYDTPEAIKAMITRKWNEAGLQGNLDRFLRIAQCESAGWQTDARNENTHPGGWLCKQQVATSTDKGLWQINDVCHPHVTEECADDPECATDYAIELYKQSGENPWYCKDRI